MHFLIGKGRIGSMWEIEKWDRSCSLELLLRNTSDVMGLILTMWIDMRMLQAFHSQKMISWTIWDFSHARLMLEGWSSDSKIPNPLSQILVENMIFLSMNPAIASMNVVLMNQSRGISQYSSWSMVSQILYFVRMQNKTAMSSSTFLEYWIHRVESVPNIYSITRKSSSRLVFQRIAFMIPSSRMRIRSFSRAFSIISFGLDHFLIRARSSSEKCMTS